MSARETIADIPERDEAWTEVYELVEVSQEAYDQGDTVNGDRIYDLILPTSQAVLQAINKSR